MWNARALVAVRPGGELRRVRGERGRWRGSPDLEDAIGREGLVEVVIERAQQQVARQDRDQHVGVEHRDQPTARGLSLMS
jgi:hypothetical protein